MNADAVRDARFAIFGQCTSYEIDEVDELLRQIAAELDAGRPVRSMAEGAAIRTAGRGYDVDAVDWFLGRLIRSEDDGEPYGIRPDPWCDLGPVSQSMGGGPSGVTGRLLYPSLGGYRLLSAELNSFRMECAKAWRDFAEQPGTYLRVARVGRRHGELRTADQQTIASVRDRWYSTAGTGGMRLTFRATVRGRSSPLVAEIAASTRRDEHGRFLASNVKLGERVQALDAEDAYLSPARRVSLYFNGGPVRIRELADDAGLPVLYTSGENFRYRAWARITFPDRRWLKFLVRGTEPDNAIMTAVDQDGTKVARYRAPGKDPEHPRDEVEITVHPDLELTDELVLAVAVSAPWLRTYFYKPTGGG